jgi:hypothetical protein
MAEILLTSGLVALIDVDDLPLLQGYRWHPQRSPKTTYAQANGPSENGRQPTFRMHRLILGATAGQFVDHRNGNGLDNRRENLRLCDRGQNNRNAQRRRDNTTGYKGVTTARSGRFRAQIHAGGRRAALGHFATAVEAAYAYNLVAAIAHGEYAQLNVIDSGVSPDFDTRIRAVLHEKAGQLADLLNDRRIVTELLGGSTLRKAS